MSIVINVLLIRKNKNNQPVLIFYIFIFTYLLYLLPYYMWGTKFNGYKEFAEDRYYAATMRIYSLFIFFIYVFGSIKQKKLFPSSSGELRWIIKNDLVFYLSFALMLLIIFYAIRGQNILDSGGYGQGNVQVSGLIEYFYIILILAVISSKQSSGIKSLMITVCVFIYCLRVVLYGSRIPVIQLAILIFIIFFNKRFTNRTVIAFTIVGLVFNELFSLIRSNPYQIVNIFSGSFGVPKLILSNQGDVFYATTVFIGLKDKGVLDIVFSIKSFFGFLLSLFFPSNSLWPETRISSYISGISPLGGGGLFPGYFYLWFGYPGVILSSFLVHKILKEADNLSLNSPKGVFIILAMSTFPRWFAYSPINLYKLCLWGIFAFIGTVFLDKTMRIMLNRNCIHDRYFI
jgi:hypothetical protein